jgi:AhpD family alkylhydroperoxidase
MSEHVHGKAVLDDIVPLGRDLRNFIPEVYDGYARLNQGAMKPGQLDIKTKELIAIAVSVAIRCDGCMAAHARNSAIRGATREEVAEAIGVALMLSGGPGTVYGPRAFDAFVEFLEAREAKAAGQAPQET